ncbi:MAG: cyclic pyranopterin monophosphate synthase MoaC [Opitutales bacterium]|nr:cyclic pyranopterin monophosphate synthase MoaC [Opitutales bacterium]
MKELTHINASGNPAMVQISDKKVTKRVACAEGSISLPEALKDENGVFTLETKKGPVVQTAIISGTMAVKKCSELIPFCHPLPIEGIDFKHSIENDSLKISCEVTANYKTGVEMEALTGVSTALLTVYDMCKSAGHDMEISGVRVVRKEGGKSDFGGTN